MKLIDPLAAGLMILVTFTSHALAQCPPQSLEPTEFGVRFGSAMAMTEDHLIVGDRHDTSLCTVRPDCSSGKVYAYQRDGSGQWVFTQEVRPAALAPYFGYGASIDIDGDRLIIGAVGPGAGGGLGAAFIFEFDGEQWLESAELLGVRDPPYTGFGGEVVIESDTALVSSLGSVVFLFQYANARWELIDMLRNPDSPSVRSDFGISLAISDNRVVIGADLERIIAPNGGAVYVYLRRLDGRLEFEQKLVAPDVFRNPRFGSSVSLDGERLAVGGSIATRTHTAQGVIYMHEFVDGQWVLTQELVADDPAGSDRLGIAVHLSGNLLAAGAPARRLPDRTGAAYLFEGDATGHWAQAAAFAPEAAQYDFGSRVGLSQGDFVVSAPRTFIASQQRGSVNIFDLGCGACPPDLDADGTLTIFDYLTFANLFDAGDMRADFDGDGELTLFDFLAFQAAFDAGCE